MTPNSPRILGGLTETVIDLGMRLNPHDWARPSACPGWTVHDIFIHLTCTLREIAAPDTVGHSQSRNSRLSADRLVSHIDVAPDRVDRLFQVIAVGMSVYQNALTALAAKQFIERHARHLGFNIP